MSKQTVNMTTAVMINQDLDASVLKALRLLHSSDSDSEDQLRQLWKQSVIEKYGNTRMPTSVLHKIQFPSTTKRSPEVCRSVFSRIKRFNISLNDAILFCSPFKSSTVNINNDSSNVITMYFPLNSTYILSNYFN